MFLMVYEYAKLVIFSFTTKKTPIIIHFFLCFTAICFSYALYHLPKLHHMVVNHLITII